MPPSAEQYVIQQYDGSEVVWKPARQATGGGRMRVTDRRLAVLRAISQRPGLSNRSVGTAAGVGPAQISRMLTRLAQLGVVENTGGGQRLGMANCWRLTAAGRELLKVCERSRRVP